MRVLVGCNGASKESLRRGGMSHCAGRQESQCWAAGDVVPGGKSQCLAGGGSGHVRTVGSGNDPLHLVAGACAGAAGGAWPKLVIASRTLLPGRSQQLLRLVGDTAAGGRGLFAGDRAEDVAVEMVEDQDETWLAENRLVHVNPESRLPVWTYPFVVLGTHCAVEQCWTARPYSAT